MRDELSIGSRVSGTNRTPWARLAPPSSGFNRIANHTNLRGGNLPTDATKSASRHVRLELHELDH
jgi:hypothetical protein